MVNTLSSPVSFLNQSLLHIVTTMGEQKSHILSKKHEKISIKVIGRVCAIELCLRASLTQSLNAALVMHQWWSNPMKRPVEVCFSHVLTENILKKQ